MEQGTAMELLRRDDSEFSALCRQSGEYDALYAMALEREKYAS